MFEIFDTLIRFVIVPVLLFLAVVTIGILTHEFFTRDNLSYNIADILGPEEDDGLGDIDDDDENTVQLEN